MEFLDPQFPLDEMEGITATMVAQFLQEMVAFGIGSGIERLGIAGGISKKFVPVARLRFVLMTEDPLEEGPSDRLFFRTKSGKETDPPGRRLGGIAELQGEARQRKLLGGEEGTGQRMIAQYRRRMGKVLLLSQIGFQKSIELLLLGSRPGFLEGRFPVLGHKGGKARGRKEAGYPKDG